MVSRFARRTDANQTAIVQAMRKAGALVEHLHGVGKGVPDLLVGVSGRFVMVEVKDGAKSPSERALTPDQETWHARWKGFPVYVVTSATEAVELLTLLRRAA